MSEDHPKPWSRLAVPFSACAVVASLTTALTSGAAAAQLAPAPSNWGPPMMWGWGWPGMMFGPFVMLLILILVIVAIVLAVRWFAAPSPPPAHHNPVAGTALDILNERFARGEIDQAEYESKRRIILQSSR